MVERKGGGGGGWLLPRSDGEGQGVAVAGSGREVELFPPYVETLFCTRGTIMLILLLIYNIGLTS